MKRSRGATPRRTTSTLANAEVVAKETHRPFQLVTLANIEYFAQK